MDIFKYVNNEKFFNPLCSKNRKIYFECINVLIEKSKEFPVLYDSDARNCVAIYLKNSELEYQEENPNETAKGWKTEHNAAAIMLYLRECGWVTPREIGRNGENVANVAVNCRKIIEFLNKMCDKSNEGALSNHIFSMYEILKSSFEEDSVRAERPYSNILKPLSDHEVELKDELLNLKDSIVDIMRVVMELQDVNSVGKFLMKDELLDRFFNDYFFIKNNGLIPSQLAFIKNKLRMISQGEMAQKMAVECAAKLKLSEAEAQEKVEGILSGLQYFLSVEYEDNMALIDARINTYYNLANTRLMLVMGSGINMESILDSFLMKMKGMPMEERGEAIQKVSDCILLSSQKYISRKSYEKSTRKERDDSAEGLNIYEISNMEKERRTKEMLENAKNRFSIENANRFIMDRLAKKKELELKSERIESREDALMFAAAVMYSGIKTFEYEVQLKDDYAETDVARITNMTIRRKGDT